MRCAGGHGWTPRACAEQGQRSAMVTPGLRGAGIASRNGRRSILAQMLVTQCPLCASQSRQSGLGLPPSRDDGPKSDRLLDRDPLMDGPILVPVLFGFVGTLFLHADIPGLDVGQFRQL